MDRHQTPADDSDKDREVEFDEVDLAELVREPEGRHSAGEDQDEQQ